MFAFTRVRHSAFSLFLVAVLAFVASAWAVVPAFADEDGAAGAVYVLTNDTNQNAVAVFRRAGDGTLSFAGNVSTGGKGSGGGLGSQGSLTLSRDGRWLFAVNAGSNDISAFAVTRNGLTLTSRVSSGGTKPISITSHERWVYVLNAGGTGNIAGFKVNESGMLSAISNSVRSLSSGAAGPAEVAFSRRGDVLVVTEKNNNAIDVYAVGDEGRAGNRNTYPSSGAVPFGFDFGQRDLLVVSEAAASAASSYAVSAEGGLRNISGTVEDFQQAACWLVVTKDGRLAFAANAHNDTISSFRVNSNGSLALAFAVAATLPAGSGPLDLGLSHNSQYLYQLTGAAHTLTGFRVHADGSLTQVGSPLSLPASAIGVAAR